MSAVTIQQMADRVAGLMEERLGVRGRGLTEKLRRGARLLPRPVRAQAQELAGFAERAHNPKLRVQIDPARVASCYDGCVRYLSAERSGSPALRAVLRITTTVALGLLATAAMVLVVHHLLGRI